ncbi:MAG: type II toxin-antitoxin system VapC family toxin [Actinomycetota bacterium]|nr:type II toxin-antitoxin system VapC family toxin [Actinomycetota bacterium]
MSAPRALADTSLFIAFEQGRPTRSEPPDELVISIITLAELRVGVLAARDVRTRGLRMATLSAAESLQPITIDDAVGSAWARMRVALREAGRRMPVNDSWIAATAISLGIPVVSQDHDYDDVPDLDVILM